MITKKQIIAVLVGAAALAAFGLQAQRSTRKPNIVLILSDDVHYSGLSITGNRKVQTPNIDSIFEQGVFFTDGYVTHAVCAPSRAGLMTGRYQARFGYETLSGVNKHAIEVDHGVDGRELFMSQLIKDAGYKTCAIGKWHLGVNDQYQPNNRGFDHFLGFRGACDYFVWDDPEKPMVRNFEPAKGSGYVTEAYTREAVQCIKENMDNPFLIYYAPSNVHSPYEVPKRYIPEGGDAYDGMLRALDESVGGILEQLEASGVADSTIVVFLNDNGGTKRHNNGPYRGGKSTYWEGGVRVPFGIKWPGVVKPGMRYGEMVSALDLLPTLVAAAGGKLPTDREYDGVDLKPFLTGKNTGSPHEQLFWRSGEFHAMRMGDFKLVWQRNLDASLKRDIKAGIRRSETDLPNYEDRGTKFYLAPTLFDLSTDIGETKNLADKYPDKVKEMIKGLDRYEAKAKEEQYGIE